MTGLQTILKLMSSDDPMDKAMLRMLLAVYALGESVKMTTEAMMADPDMARMDLVADALESMITQLGGIAEAFGAENKNRRNEE